MKVTVCELSDDQSSLASEWRGLVEHVAAARSEVVLLPEMPFYPWWMISPNVDADVWGAAVAGHQNWQHRMTELNGACILGTFPTCRAGERVNQAFLWKDNTYLPAHEKHFLPNESGFWEATWCSRGDGAFQVTDGGNFRVGFLICTELWSFESARLYGRAGAHVLATPRSSLMATRDKWLVAGRAAAIASGTFSISSNRRGMGAGGVEFGGEGWVIDPDGKVLGVTSQLNPFLTLELDLEHAVQAKATYPRDVFL